MIPTLLYSRISSFTAFASTKKKGSIEPNRGEYELQEHQTMLLEHAKKLKQQNQDNREFESLDT